MQFKPTAHSAPQSKDMETHALRQQKSVFFSSQRSISYLGSCYRTFVDDFPPSSGDSNPLPIAVGWLCSISPGFQVRFSLRRGLCVVQPLTTGTIHGMLSSFVFWPPWGGRADIILIISCCSSNVTPHFPLIIFIQFADNHRNGKSKANYFSSDLQFAFHMNETVMSE